MIVPFIPDPEDLRKISAGQVWQVITFPYSHRRWAVGAKVIVKQWKYPNLVVIVHSDGEEDGCGPDFLINDCRLIEEQ